MNTNDKAIVILLSKPALDFVREVRRKVDTDSTYLDSHMQELREKVKTYLMDAGLLWDNDILTREAIPMLTEAIMQLRLIEK